MKLAAAAPTDVTYAQLKWMSAALALALAAHVAALPLWALGVAAAAIALRLSLAARGLAAPARGIRLGIASVSITLMFLQYHTFNGVDAGSALLSLVAGLKLLETQSRRDLYVLSLIIYFLNLGALLRSESFWLFAYVVGASWFTTAALLRLTPTAPLPAWRISMRYAGRVAAQALPLALVLWLFFPRFDGPLWQMPLDGRGAQSGLSDSMSPGDITELALSDDIAFRVRFTDAAPPPEERYWRGPVLHDFDGHTWRGAAAGAGTAGALVPIGRAYRYILSLEPHPHNWVFALDWPDRWDLAAARLTGDYTLVQPDPVSRHLDISATSHTRVASAEPLGAALRERDVEIPRNQNPRTLALAAALRQAHPDDRDYARAVLAMFREQQFFYTLEPPPLGADSIDAFLFDTKRGYCGHYASAFAVLMRAVGVPTRVVTGYQGGAFNRYAGDWIVRQSNAHAWDEMWIEGAGWLRVDPTSAIAPARVERGLADALTAGDPLAARWGAHLSWLADLRLRMDALGQLWRKRILGFDQLSQNRLLEFMRIPDPGGQRIVLVLSLGLVLAFAWLTWQVRRELHPQPKDPLLRAYARLCVKRAAIGLPREAHEGAEAFAARVARSRPDLARQVTALCRCYSRLRYGASRPSRALESFSAQVRAFRPGRSAP